MCSYANLYSQLISWELAIYKLLKLEKLVLVLQLQDCGEKDWTYKT
jgi:hypothetical protein